jgi:uncharacterized protein YjbI with pentapeptide repeats
MTVAYVAADERAARHIESVEQRRRCMPRPEGSMRSRLAFASMILMGLIVPSCGAFSQDLLSYVDLNSPEMKTAEMTRDELLALLRASTAAKPADLTGRRLSGLDLAGFDLSGVTLRLAKLNRTKLNGARLNGAILNQAWMIDADLTDANLTKASLLSTQMQRAKLDGADLSGARITGDLSGASMVLSRLVGADASADMRNQSMGLMRGVLKSANLKGADLKGANLSRTNLEFANLRNADLTDCNLTHAQLAGADLTGAILTNADFTEADLTSTLLPDDAALAGARNLDKAFNLDRARRAP